MTGNTILITGGASGIGRGLAEAFHKLGNQVIISGRRQDALDAVTTANPGMASIRLDLTETSSIQALVEKAISDFPSLNVVINNAGIMRKEDLSLSPFSVSDAEETILTNLLGTIRVTTAVLPHLLKQPDSTLITVSSGLAFVPHIEAPSYSASKSGVHFYTMALREQLRDTSVKVVEIVPPYVQTELLGTFQLTDPNAMPLRHFIEEVLGLLESGAPEVVVENCKPFRFAAESGRLKEFMAMTVGH